ncbi:hypothetical protein D030_3120 [Vibrio parahaemolyticus AQ3810]|nr:hypothetical protein D030_3120 [Vibrio parahaemolyticus AQ3810]
MCLMCEGQTVVVSAKFNVQRKADTPQEVLTLHQFAVFRIGKKAVTAHL